VSIDWMRQNDAAEMLKKSGIESDDYMFSGSGVMPWHGTNVTVLDGNPNAEEALVAAKLNWEVAKQPVFVGAPDGGFNPIPRYFAVVREQDHKALGIVQQRYQLLQNSDAFGWANFLVGGDGFHFETAGSLKGGRIVYLTAKTPFKVELPGGDRLETYLLISNRHDGSGAVTVAIITIRVVCKNTLSRSIAGALGEVKIRHTISLPARMAQAQKVLGLAQGATDRAEEIATKLIRAKLTDDKFHIFTKLLLADELPAEPSARQLASVERTRERIADVYFNNETEDGIRGTAWGAYNAVTFYNDHLTPRREMTEGDGSKADSRMLAIVSGNNIGDKALALLSKDLGGGRWLREPKVEVA
jgi:phage/plasmid-like protein (TIGR03299 family)